MFIVFYTTCFFTLIYIIKKAIVYGVITFGGWMALGLMWLLINPMDTGYAVALLFNGIGILFLITVIVQLFQELEFRKRGYEESDLD